VFSDKNKASREEAKKMKYMEGCFESWFRKNYSLIPCENKYKNFHKLHLPGGVIDCFVSIDFPDGVEMRFNGERISEVVNTVDNSLLDASDVNIIVHTKDDRMRYLAQRELREIIAEELYNPQLLLFQS